MISQYAEIYGLILAGGYSQRMGVDKAELTYRGERQIDRLWKILQRVGLRSYISCRTDQATTYQSDFPLLPDTRIAEGPLTGIMTAFDHFPDKAWLVLACDMPLIDEQSILQLIDKRDGNYVATVYVEPKKNNPEPLFCIWELIALPQLSTFWESGGRSPLTFLQMHTYKGLFPKRPELLTNVNTPEDYQKVTELL